MASGVKFAEGVHCCDIPAVPSHFVGRWPLRKILVVDGCYGRSPGGDNLVSGVDRKTTAVAI